MAHVDRERAERARDAKALQAEFSKQLDMKTQCDAVCEIVIDFLQYIDYNHGVKIKDLLELREEEVQAQLAQFAHPDILDRFVTELK